MKTNYTYRARGSVLIYSLVLMTIMLGLTSLAVDYSHAQIVKSELQRAADALALGEIQYYTKNGTSSFATVVAYTPTIMNPLNPVDANSHIAATYTATWGYWNTATQSFVATGNASTAPYAVQVKFFRTAATGNAVPLTFPLIGTNGKSPIRMTTDVVATATAVNFGGQTASPTIGGIMDPWLAGMANGATASDEDTAPAESPAQVMSVVPGTYITVTNVSGSVNHDPSLPKDPANGNTGQIYSHMCDDSNGTPVQNGIGDVISPIDALLGVFLKSNSPDQNAAPTVVRDYSTQAARDQVQANDIQPQQPFLIGTGTNSSGTTQTFRVPPGCTRLYMGPMDGHQWANNGGSFTATVTQSQDIQLVQ